MGEELDRRDIGIAVDDAAGDERAHVGLKFGQFAEPGHEIPAGRRIARQPDEQGDHQPGIARCHQDQRAQEIDRHIDDDLGELHHRVAHPHRRLHHLGGDAAGEIVMEEVHALAQHIAVRLPADAHGEIAAKSLMRDGFSHETEERQHHQDEHSHADQFAAIVVPEGGAIGDRQEIDEIAEERKQVDLDCGNGRRECHRSNEQRQKRSRVMPGKGQQAGCRLVRPLWRKGIDAGFKPAEKGFKHGDVSWRSLSDKEESGKNHHKCGKFDPCEKKYPPRPRVSGQRGATPSARRQNTGDR